MGQEPSGPFITSMLELKLDQNTMFEWQKHSQESTEIPHYKDLLEFINSRAQASECISSETKRVTRNESRRYPPGKSITSFAACTTDANCTLCKNEKHPLYVCTRFKSLPRDKMVSLIKSSELCLRPGHFSRQCPSLNRCRKCQKPHHTLIHSENNEVNPHNPQLRPRYPAIRLNSLLKSSSRLLMVPQLRLVHCTSFISERITQSLCLPRSRHNIRISGIASGVYSGGLEHPPVLPDNHETNLAISSVLV